MSPATLLFLASSLAAPAPAPEPAKSIACKERSEYIGGIDRITTLVIEDAPKRTWSHTFEMSPGPKVGHAGTYELTDGLAVFTGKPDGAGAPYRFAVNYDFPDGKPHFRGFFADGKSLRHRHRWYRPVPGGWAPSEEWDLFLPRTRPAGLSWKVVLTGQRTTWDDKGRPTRTPVNGEVEFTRPADSPAWQFRTGAAWQLGTAIHLSPGAGDLTYLLVGNDTPLAGVLRGFHPNLHQRPARP